MKPGGYSDSGADIAYELQKNQIEVITPVEDPNIHIDKDWVFPDTEAGIQQALSKGANTFWLNTILYKGHVTENFFDGQIAWIGQNPNRVELYDDKFHTNELLRQHQIPIPKTELIVVKDMGNYNPKITFPVVLKPIRGRGSQGISLVENSSELDQTLKHFFSSDLYGNSAYVEQYLSGQEITITVMPPGTYSVENNKKEFTRPWCLPAVKRFNHINGIAPYSGVVAVTDNSSVLDDDELQSDSILEVYRHCEKAAELVGIKAPIRIDCRADTQGNYLLFDLNMKPNMTGPSRAHRINQDSLTLLAARKIGWNYYDLLKNILDQRWKHPE